MNRKDNIMIKTHIQCEMPDGVKLSNDIYLPDAAGPFPCVLVRTPYGNNAEKKVAYSKKLASAGYAVVIQDVPDDVTVVGIPAKVIGSAEYELI